MEENLITYDTANIAKDAGYDIPCLNYYTTEYSRDKKPYITKGIEYDSDGYTEFDWNCNTEHSKGLKAPYPNTYHKSQRSAPTQSLLQKWLRDIHNLYIEVYIKNNDLLEEVTFSYLILFKNEKSVDHLISEGNIQSYEDALEKGLQEALLIIRNK